MAGLQLNALGAQKRETMDGSNPGPQWCGGFMHSMAGQVPSDGL